MTIVGMPKYDAFIREMGEYQHKGEGSMAYVFAASTTVIRDESNIRFLKKLAESTQNLGRKLIVKLHPRSSEEPAAISKLIGSADPAHIEVVKQGDSTSELLKHAHALVTVSSTVVLDALLMDRECIVA